MVLFYSLSGGVSPVEEHGWWLLGDVLSLVDEVLMSEMVRFQGTMSISIPDSGGGTLSSTPLFGAFREAHRDMGLIC